MRVMKKYGDDYIITALFHDLLEDTDATEEEILQLSNSRVLKAVKLLTKTKNISSKNYITGILSNGIAKAVKCEDRIHNLQCALETDDPIFILRYLRNTEEYYVGKFDNRLDAECKKLKDYFESLRNRYLFTLDTSVEGLIYRTDQRTNESCVYNREEKRWIPCDPYFWADIGDFSKAVSIEEAEKLI